MKKTMSAAWRTWRPAKRWWSSGPTSAADERRTPATRKNQTFGYRWVFGRAFCGRIYANWDQRHEHRFEMELSCELSSSFCLFWTLPTPPSVHNKLIHLITKTNRNLEEVQRESKVLALWFPSRFPFSLKSKLKVMSWDQVQVFQLKNKNKEWVQMAEWISDDPRTNQ